ncbi:MAG TPA: DUF4340 domain-containing protein [Polyangiaceae bacterium]|nr:DUF4340 domain-containing protein [Polyangiaceae bacterium]
MSREKLIIFGVVLLGLLGVLVYKQAKRDESLGAPMASAKDYPTISASEDIDKLSITNGDKGEVLLEKVPDPKAEATDAGPAMTWVLTKPVSAAANQQAVKDVITNLHDLKVDSPVSIKLDDEVRKQKQLDPAHAVHVVAWKAGSKVVDELFGKSGPAGELVVVADKPDQVWAAKGYSSYLYTKEPKDFRFKELFRFDDANASQVTITNSHGVLSFTKGDKWVATLDKKPLPRFDEEKLKDMLRTYKVLNAEDFGDGKTLAETGLDKPDGVLTIQLKDNAGKYEVALGKVATGTNHWAKRSDDDTIYQLTNYVSEWVVSEPSKYQAAADAGAGDAGARKAETAKKK